MIINEISLYQLLWAASIQLSLLMILWGSGIIKVQIGNRYY
jgi:hypothetical protein